MDVGSFLSQTLVVFRIRTGLLVGTGPRRHDSQRLWELDWLRLPSSTVASIELHAPTSSTQKLKLMGRGMQFTYIPTLTLTWRLPQVSDVE